MNSNEYSVINERTMEWMFWIWQKYKKSSQEGTIDYLNQFSTLSVQTEKAEASPAWVLGWIFSCKSNKWAQMSVEELFFVFLCSSWARSVFHDSVPVTWCHCMPKGHTGSHSSKFFILQMKTPMCRKVKQASKWQ